MADDVLDVGAAPEDKIEERQEAKERRHGDEDGQREGGQRGGAGHVVGEASEDDDACEEVEVPEGAPEAHVDGPACDGREAHHHELVGCLVDESVLDQALQHDHAEEDEEVGERRGRHQQADEGGQRRRVVSGVRQQRGGGVERDGRCDRPEVGGVE